MANISSPAACFVPNCNSSVSKTPNKHFFNVPLKKEERAKWFAAVGVTGNVSALTVKKCCEDHFDMETDVSNLAQHNFFIQMGMKRSRLLLKRGVVPHIFSRPRNEEPVWMDRGSSETAEDEQMYEWSSDNPIQTLSPEVEIVELAEAAGPSEGYKMQASASYVTKPTQDTSRIRLSHSEVIPVFRPQPRHSKPMKRPWVEEESPEFMTLSHATARALIPSVVLEEETTESSSFHSKQPFGQFKRQSSNMKTLKNNPRRETSDVVPLLEKYSKLSGIQIYRIDQPISRPPNSKEAEKKNSSGHKRQYLRVEDKKREV